MTAVISTRTGSRSGFSLIEMIVVVAIMAVLAGVAVPYYQDAVSDARKNTLKSNVASLRKVINEFRGDQGRGPFRVQVRADGSLVLDNPKALGPTGSELTNGPLQVKPDSNIVSRRTNLKYLPNLPVLEDPETGAQIVGADAAAPLKWAFKSTSSAYFSDVNGDKKFDMDKEFAWVDADGDGNFATSTDSKLFNATGTMDFITADVIQPLDYIDIVVTDSQGTTY